MSTFSRFAPYEDRVEDGGRVLIYEGHDVAKTPNGPRPKEVDQPDHNPNGSLTQNGLFAEAARRYEQGQAPEIVRVYEKIRPGIWVYNGLFKLVDSWTEVLGNRKIFKFKLEIVDTGSDQRTATIAGAEEDDRVIPSWVKLEVWKRDKGRCTKCGANCSLHFDHIIPYSKGGSSKDPKNIQILCGRHNITKRDEIGSRDVDGFQTEDYFLRGRAMQTIVRRIARLVASLDTANLILT
jgi:HNH endonuclease